LSAERGFQQASWIPLTKFCLCNNSYGDNLARYFTVDGVKFSAGSLENFAHRRERLRFEGARF